MIVGYIRVSTTKQHPENQMDEIKRYADTNGMIVDKWIMEVVSGKAKVKERKLGRQIKFMNKGDTLIVTEISRLSRLTRAGIFAGNGADVVFNSGVINHKPERTSRYIFCARNAGTTITIKDGTFKNDRAKNSFFWADGGAVIYVEGGNFTGVASNNKVVTSNGGQVIITGGKFNFDPTAWVADGYTATKSNSTWTVSQN